jgi:uncharacterized membrane protein YccF (DUF307 family)
MSDGESDTRLRLMVGSALIDLAWILAPTVTIMIAVMLPDTRVCGQITNMAVVNEATAVAVTHLVVRTVIRR